MVSRQEDCGTIYVESVYFAALSITSVGYGDILQTPLERATNAFLLILGQLFVAKVGLKRASEGKTAWTWALEWATCTCFEGVFRRGNRWNTY